MNAVEIEEAVSQLAEAPFDPAEFPFAFLEAFGNKSTTIKKLRSTAKSSTSNKSDLPGGVLQRNHIHIAVCPVGQVGATLAALRQSPATASQKARFILATDGQDFQAENLADGETVACDYPDFHNHFGVFLPLAGITTVKQISENPFDIKATGRLNKLYVELLSTNPDWDTAERRDDLNHFFARLIFCFFAEDTNIFGPPPINLPSPSGRGVGGEGEPKTRAHGEGPGVRGPREQGGIFTQTVAQMSASDSSNTHEILAELFRAMNTPTHHEGRPDSRYRDAADIARWALPFPYVNGGLFSGPMDVPRFSRAARSYLLHVGGLDWTQINPDIFGSMIQAVADDEERGALGMHYTSVPNILKVLNPLFLDDLRAKLDDAGDNARKLLNLRNRLMRIRVFDPACGSGNFLVIAYKEMRAIEAEINRRRNEPKRRSEIPVSNFRGIELRSFPVEIARLALIIAEYQCDVLYRGLLLAREDVLPLDAENWITCGNALRLDWLKICPPTGTGVKVRGDDLFETPLDQAEIDFENEGGETYICGNPPYAGATVKAPKGASKEVKDKLKAESALRKADLQSVFAGRTSTWGSLDYVSGWFMKAVDYGCRTTAVSAFVSTNSVCQGQQVPTLWPLVFGTGHQIPFAHTSFKWANLAAHNAGVTVVIVGLALNPQKSRRIYTMDSDGLTSVKEVEHINAYLVPAQDVIVEKRREAADGFATMIKGSAPTDGGHLLLSRDEVAALDLTDQQRIDVIRRFLGSEDSIDGTERFCLWMDEMDYAELSSNPKVLKRLNAVARMRRESPKKQTQFLADKPYLFGEIRQQGFELPVVIPRHSSETREYLPFALGTVGDIVADSASALYDAPLWNVAVFASRVHLIWIATVCGKLETRYRYSNTLGWNTFPVPPLSDQNKSDLTRCAEDILLAREAHFPATIADLYDPDAMPANLRAAHDRNDETLERIYIGRRFKNDTERLEKLFEMYTEMTSREGAQGGATKPRRRTARRRSTEAEE